MDISEMVGGQSEPLNPSQHAVMDTVGSTLKAYINATKELLNGRYASFRELAPAYLASPGNILTACCDDGVAIRFERRVDESRMIVAWADASLAEFVPKLSQNLIHFVDGSLTNTFEGGILVTFTVQRKGTAAAEPLLSFKVAFDAVVERPEHLQAPPHKPFCLLSVRNELDVELHLESADSGPSVAAPERLIVRNTVRMPIGWDCIEVYPFFQVEQWKPEYASVWAETDVLAAVVAAQFKEQRYNSLDPNADARQRFARLLESYKALLDSNPDREEQLQQFLSAHPALLCPAHVKMWPKAPLGNRVTDFVFQEAAGDYLLVELERSTHRLFLQNGYPSRELDHARGQITQWKRYLEDNLSTVQRELGFSGISTNPKGLIVIGRSKSLTTENARDIVSMENESPKLKIMTYDGIYENAKAVIDNILGPSLNVTGSTRVYRLPSQEP